MWPLRPRAHESRRDHIGSWGSSPSTRGACRGPGGARTMRPDTRPDRPPNEGATDRPHADAPRARSPLSAIHRLWSATRPAHHRRLSVGRATVPRVGVGTSQGDVVTSIEPGSRWTERLNPRNWTLTWKLVVVGLVPALLALALGVLRIADDADQAAELGRSSRLVEIRDQVAGAANALRQERDEATLFVAGNRSGDRGVLDIGFGQADGEIDEMANALRGTGELDPATLSARQRAEEALGRLVQLRASVNGDPPIPYDQVVSRYSEHHRPGRRPRPRPAAPAAHAGHRGPGRRPDRRHRSGRAPLDRAHRARRRHPVREAAAHRLGRGERGERPAGRRLPGLPGLPHPGPAQHVRHPSRRVGQLATRPAQDRHPGRAVRARSRCRRTGTPPTPPPAAPPTAPPSRSAPSSSRPAPRPRTGPATWPGSTR